MSATLHEICNPPTALDRACDHVLACWRRYLPEAEAIELAANFRIRCENLAASAGAPA